MKKNRLLQTFSKSAENWFLPTSWISFEVNQHLKKHSKKWMKNWMWFFFLAKIFRFFYGNLWKQQFKNLCNFCIAKNAYAIFTFFWIFEFCLPMLLYWIGFSPSVAIATQWVTKGLILVNNKIVWNARWIINVFDTVAINPSLWPFINALLVKMLFYASKASHRRSCLPKKIWSYREILWAHFFAIPNYFIFDFKTLSFYYWKQALPNQIKYYFAVDIANIIKFVTI